MKRKPALPVRIHAQRVKLKPDERDYLKQLLSRGQGSVRVYKRARILQALDQGLSAPKAGESAGMSDQAARDVRERYFQGGLDRALHDSPRPGQQRRLDSSQEAQVVAMVCARPPEGQARWSISLIAKEVVARDIVDSIGDETIRQVLLRHDLKPWREKNVVRHRTR